MRQILVFACVISSFYLVAPVLAQGNWPDTSKINKWFDDQKGKTYDIQKPGTLNSPSGTIQTPGNLQKPGNIQIPKGWQAIKTVKADCESRLTVGADALFDFDQSTLTSDAEITLKALGPAILKLGAHPVKIEGHTDAIGTDAYNQNLSEKRAQRVKNWLLENHYIPVETDIVGYGKKKPIAPNTNPDGTDNPKGRQLNRRVVIIVDTCKDLGEKTSLTQPDAEEATGK